MLTSDRNAQAAQSAVSVAGSWTPDVEPWTMSAPSIVPRYWVGVFTPPVIKRYSAEKMKSVRSESVPAIRAVFAVLNRIDEGSVAPRRDGCGKLNDCRKADDVVGVATDGDGGDQGEVTVWGRPIRDGHGDRATERWRQRSEKLVGPWTPEFAMLRRNGSALAGPPASVATAEIIAAVNQRCDRRHLFPPEFARAIMCLSVTLTYLNVR